MVDFDPTRRLMEEQKRNAEMNDYLMRVQAGKVVVIGGNQSHPVYQGRFMKS
jgi:hypothetical protein